jgi:hypothetical protein
MKSFDDVPHIQAQCSNPNCGFIYDMKFGPCPKCHYIGVKWAHLVTDEEMEYGSEAQRQLREALDNLRRFDTEPKSLHDFVNGVIKEQINAVNKYYPGRLCTPNSKSESTLEGAYAASVMQNPLQEEDHIRLHALGVIWEG